MSTSKTVTENNYRVRNQKVFNEIEALFEKIQMGNVRIDFNIYEKRITKIKVYGSEEYRFNEQGSLSVNR